MQRRCNRVFSNSVFPSSSIVSPVFDISQIAEKYGSTYQYYQTYYGALDYKAAIDAIAPTQVCDTSVDVNDANASLTVRVGRFQSTL